MRIGFQEILLLALVILLLFGGRKIPELMKNLGKGINSFRKGMNDLAKDEDLPKNESNNGSAAT
ncbi:hypothetical protein FACS189429_8370 [Bacteroidia bacterium]|nr:hypothetical protein FACS189429_8370 [Bacteroidia bacterium]